MSIQKQKEEAAKEQAEVTKRRATHHRALSTNPFDQFPDANELDITDTRHVRGMSTNPFDEYSINDIKEINNVVSDGDDTIYHAKLRDIGAVEIIHLNSESKTTANRVPKRGQSSKMHVPDQSFVSLDMSFDINDGNGEMPGFVSLDMGFDDDDGALRLQRITSASSMKAVVSL